MTPRSRRASRPRFGKTLALESEEGARNAGCPMRPQPRVRWGVKSAREYSQRRHRKTSGIPHAMVLRLIRDLPGDEFLLPPSPRGLNDTSNPGWADDASARLDINNGCQDHTTSPSATLPLVLCASLDRSRLSPPRDLMRARHHPSGSEMGRASAQGRTRSLRAASRDPAPDAACCACEGSSARQILMPLRHADLRGSSR